jgi:limonene-1,2-epoxide hydrolase
MAGPDSAPAPLDIVTAFVGAWNRLDLDTVVGLLSPDIEYHNMPLARLAGRDAVEAYLRSAGPFESCEWRIRSIAASGCKVLTERVDELVVAGTRISLPVMGVFEVEDGLIRRWRDYFDLASYRAQWPQRENAA